MIEGFEDFNNYSPVFENFYVKQQGLMSLIEPLPLPLPLPLPEPEAEAKEKAKEEAKEAKEEAKEKAKEEEAEKAKEEAKEYEKEYEKDEKEAKEEAEKAKEEPEVTASSSENFDIQEGFSNSSSEPDYAKRASSVNLILKALLFACLFYVLAHPDTYTQAIRKMSSKLTKEHGLYICMAVFAVVYYIIGIFL